LLLEFTEVGDRDFVHGTVTKPEVEDGGVTLAHLIDTSSL